MEKANVVANARIKLFKRGIRVREAPRNDRSFAGLTAAFVVLFCFSALITIYATRDN